MCIIVPTPCHLSIEHYTIYSSPVPPSLVLAIEVKEKQPIIIDIEKTIVLSYTLFLIQLLLYLYLKQQFKIHMFVFCNIKYMTFRHTPPVHLACHPNSNGLLYKLSRHISLLYISLQMLIAILNQ